MANNLVSIKYYQDFPSDVLYTTMDKIKLCVYLDKILHFSPKLSLKLEYIVCIFLIQSNKEKRSDYEQNRGN
jgi:hypothetical protein